ncbi:NADP-dependent oxidoreductase domain-containing protein [Crassisporium funariophilum]|nr:NADP-dependent oxidoreductase domain-containing protein [Crassisporium funariophilum]
MTKLITLNDGTQIPWLGFGTGTALYGKDATDLIRLAIENEITHLDGAQMYNNEDTLGAGIRASGKPRSELFITTKLKPDMEPGQSVKESLKASLAKLGVDYVDLFLIHSPTPANKDGKLKQLWEGMEEVKREGLAKSIGVSNFKVEDLKVILEDAKVIPSMNQIELHPYVWKAAEPIVKLCEENGIHITSYGGQTPIVRVQGGPLDPVLASIRKRLETTRGKPVTTGQVLTKWILQKNAIVVTTTTKESRIKEFLDTQDVPDLTTEEVHEIEATGAQLHKRAYMRHVFGE